MKDTLRVVVPAPASATADSIWNAAYNKLLWELQFARAYPTTSFRKIFLREEERQHIMTTYTLEHLAQMDLELFAFEIEVERETPAT